MTMKIKGINIFLHKREHRTQVHNNNIERIFLKKNIERIFYMESIYMYMILIFV